jgi:hypothetical protein
MKQITHVLLCVYSLEAIAATITAAAALHSYVYMKQYGKGYDVYRLIRGMRAYRDEKIVFFPSSK